MEGKIALAKYLTYCAFSTALEECESEELARRMIDVFSDIMVDILRDHGVDTR